MDTFEDDFEVGHDEEEQVEEAPRKGLILSEDDFEVGQLVAVHSIKGTNEAAPIMGQPLKFKEFCFPYIVANLLLEGSRVITLDARYLRFMKISEAYVQAQMPPPQKKGPQA